MTPIELAKVLSLKVLNVGNGNEKKIEGIYCCDLLSLVMGRAKANDAWITVMGNINTVAVAVLSDVACIVVSEDLQLDDQAIAKAAQQDVCVLKSELPTFETAEKIHENII